MTVQTLPTAVEVTSGSQTNALQKVDFASLLDFLLAVLGSKSGQGPETIASAATLNLDAVVETRDIVISGTTTITAVTVEAGKVFRVRASGAFTLTNNADIVTGRGANLLMAAGDTFIVRATAANKIEVLMHSPVVVGLPPVYGGRAWMNYKGTTSGAGRATRNSGNVSSVGFVSTGRYRMNFAQNMPHADYAVTFGYAQTIGAVGSAARTINILDQNVAYVEFICQDNGGVATDFDLVNVVVTC